MAASLDQSLGIFDYLPKAETSSLSNSMTDMGSGTSSVRGHEEEDDEESGEGQGFSQSYSSSFPACSSSTTTDTAGTTATTTTTGTAAVNVSVGAVAGTRKRIASSRAQGASDDKRQKKLELNRLASRESRKRKKRRLEELQRSVLILTHENHTLREQNELLRQMLITRLPSSELASALGGAAGGVGGGAGAVTAATAGAAPMVTAAAMGGMGFVAAKGEMNEEESHRLGQELGGEGGHDLGSSISSAAVDFFLPHPNMILGGLKESGDAVEGGERLRMVGAA
ncbi:hypothetical protein VYU27_007021 [Nannochloropsis oceanica]